MYQANRNSHEQVEGMFYSPFFLDNSLSQSVRYSYAPNHMRSIESKTKWRTEQQPATHVQYDFTCAL